MLRFTTMLASCYLVASVTFAQNVDENDPILIKVQRKGKQTGAESQPVLSAATSSHVKEVNTFPLKPQFRIQNNAAQHSVQDKPETTGRAFLSQRLTPQTMQESIQNVPMQKSPVYVPQATNPQPVYQPPATKIAVKQPTSYSTNQDILSTKQNPPIPLSKLLADNAISSQVKQDRTLNTQPNYPTYNFIEQPKPQQAEERSSYSWYDHSNSAPVPAAPVPVAPVPVPVPNPVNYHYQQPYQQPYENNYHVQNVPTYNYVDELSEKFDDEESKEKYLEETAKFIGGGVATLFALGLIMVLLSVVTTSIVASQTGRRRRNAEEELPAPNGSSWNLEDAIQCASRFWCEMEQWDQKYPSKPDESTSNTTERENDKKQTFDDPQQDRRPRSVKKTRKHCGKIYTKCPVNFGLMRTVWKMIS